MRPQSFKNMVSEKISTIFLAVLLIALAVLLRLAPHWPNFAPIGGLALLAGCYFSRRVALVIPLLAMLISDFWLGFYEWPVALTVYGSFMMTVFLGVMLRNKKQWLWITGGSLVGSVIFFLATNTAVWAFTPWYSKTVSGLGQCLTMALPFFRNTLLGDLFYTGLFFLSYELLSAIISFTIKSRSFQRIIN